MRVPATRLMMITLRAATTIRITPGAAASLDAAGDGEGEDPVGDGLPSPGARKRTAEASGRDVVNDARVEKAVHDARPGDRRDADVRSNATDVPLGPCSSSLAAPSAGPELCPRV